MICKRCGNNGITSFNIYADMDLCRKCDDVFWVMTKEMMVKFMEKQ